MTDYRKICLDLFVTSLDDKDLRNPSQVSRKQEIWLHLYTVNER